MLMRDMYMSTNVCAIFIPLSFLIFYALYLRNTEKDTCLDGKAKFPYIQALFLLQSWLEKKRISCAIKGWHVLGRMCVQKRVRQKCYMSPAFPYLPEIPSIVSHITAV